MKGSLFTLLILFCWQLMSFGNVVPLTASDIPSNSIGLYQVDKRIVVREKPDDNSKILSDRQINYTVLSGANTDYMFAVLIPDKELGYVYATDADGDWVQIIYDKKNNLKGWVYKNDDFQFFPWINFYSMYGRKYGLYRLKNTPSDVSDIHSQPDENSQILGKMTRPKQIRLTGIEGNWALVTVLDVNCFTNTGYVQWRDINGQFYLFPDIK
ncbi:MAG: hypothetical protein LUB59_00430 [Candidatus Gastranaerophilales bacterium]|nr:hypothetical protein [Candidatus Gastranaerophilales bacterium]